MASSLHSDTSSSGSYHPPTGPILKKPYTPVQGAYIVFTLDPVATLEALQDPIASDQAQALPRRKYVGCVVQDWDLASPWRRYNRCSCIILSQGLPKADPAHGVEETMCVPIAPADHPDGRQGVAPSKALPWENLYHHSLLAVDLRLTSKAGDYTDSPRLSRPDLHYMHRFFDNDINRSLSLHREYLAAHPSARSLRESIQSTSPLPLPSQAHMPLPETSSTPPTSVHSEVHIATVDAAPVGPAPMVRPAQFDDPEACDCSPEGSGPRRVSVMGGDEVALYEDRPVVTEAPMASESASIASMSVHSVFERAPDEDDREGSTDVVFQTMADSILGYEDPRDRFLPVADFSLDLSIVTEFCDGCLIDDDFEAIERIKEESEQRTKARLELAEREKLTKWALEVESPLDAIVPDESQPEMGLPQERLTQEVPPEEVSPHDLPSRKKGPEVARNEIWPLAQLRRTILRKHLVRREDLPHSASQRKPSSMSGLLSICTFGCIPTSSQGSDPDTNFKTEERVYRLTPGSLKGPFERFVSRLKWPLSLHRR